MNHKIYHDILHTVLHTVWASVKGPLWEETSRCLGIENHVIVWKNLPIVNNISLENYTTDIVSNILKKL